MKIKITFLALVLGLLPFASVEAYSATDYDPDHRPSNLASAIAHPACAVRVQEFASKHKAFIDKKEYWESGVGETEMRAEYKERGLDVNDPMIQLSPGFALIDLRMKFHFLKEDYTKYFTECLTMAQVEETKVPVVVEKEVEDEAQKLREAELLKQQQLAKERARKEAEAAQKRQEEIDAAALRNQAEQAARVNTEEPSESKPVEDAQTETPDAPEEPSTIDTPTEKPSFFQRIRSFFSRWF